MLYLERRNDGTHQSKHRFQSWRAFERAEMLEGFAMEDDTKRHRTKVNTQIVIIKYICMQGLKWCSITLASCKYFDGDDLFSVLNHCHGLASTEASHRNMVLLQMAKIDSSLQELSDIKEEVLAPYLRSRSRNGIDRTWVAEYFVLAHEGSRSAMGNHEPGVKAWVLRELKYFL